MQTISTLILVVEPNELLQTPYKYLDDLGTVSRVPTIGAALKEVIWNVPTIVFLSASIEPKKSLLFLDTLKDASRFSLIPLVVVVDISREISNVLGTSWGGKIAVIDCYISKRDLISTISRIS
jgi:hypothetical protein